MMFINKIRIISYNITVLNRVGDFLNAEMKQNKINFKMLFLFILMALIAGGIGALLGGDMKDFNNVQKPVLTPPAITFPIVWTILYVLMGISSYLICCNKTDQKFIFSACISYILQLIVNAIWPLIFFRFNLYFIAFLWLILLIILVINMIIKFYKLKPLAAILQIPYVIWLIFAGYLNLAIYFLNR